MGSYGKDSVDPAALTQSVQYEVVFIDNICIVKVIIDGMNYFDHGSMWLCLRCTICKLDSLLQEQSLQHFLIYWSLEAVSST